jgi:predicted RNA-binding protein with PUA-like domain
LNYWLLKSDPETYSWINLEQDKQTIWDGIRNYQARNNLKLMKKGDIALFYHSNLGTDIVGQVKIIREAYQDPSTDDKNWFVIDIKIDKKYKKSLTLAEMKKNPMFQNIGLIKQSRLSVMPITNEEYAEIYRLCNGK